MLGDDRGDDDWLFIVAFIFALAILLCGGCATVSGPVTWRADQAAAAMQMCQVACHPRGMGSWDSVGGVCTCAMPSGH